MKFDASGKRIVSLAPSKPEREPAYWFEREKIDEYGFCDEPVGDRHLCGRFRGHGGSCAAMVKTTSGGRTTRRLEYA